MIIPIGFRETIEKCIEHNTGAIFKNFFDEETTPNWEQILYCINQELELDSPGQDFLKNLGSEETAYGNVIVSHKLYLASHLQDTEIKKYFPKISEALEVIRKSTNIAISGIGPKVCLGPHIIRFHKDQWPAFALQCEGKAKWILSDTEDGTGSYLEEFYPERGDMIFFPEGMWHRIETQGAPRGGIQFNAMILSK